MSFSKILRLFVLTISSILSIAESLSGENVCTRVENLTLTIKETYTEPVIVQTFTWCLQVPPRCSKTRVENRERYRIKTTVEERKISECCDGYILDESHDEDLDAEMECIPFCESCENGICLKPNVCQCKPGYLGDNCALKCPAGTWGRNCMKECDCGSGRSCNPVSGICECPAGWEGVGCKLPCSVGWWGLRCESICPCDGEHMSCDPETGDCHIEKNWNAEVDLSRNSTTEDLFRAVQISGLLLEPKSTAPTISETIKPKHDTDTTISNFDDPLRVPEFQDFSVTRFSKTTESPKDDISQTISEFREEFRIIKPEFPVTNSAESQSTTSFTDSTKFEGSISQTDPEVRLTIAPRLKEQGFYENNGDDNHGESRVKTVVQAPHPSYVKTVQKEQTPQISYDTTVLIVVGSVVSLCITTLAALMVFYLRSRVFESIPLSIYNNDNNEGSGREKGNTIRSLNITNTTLPPLPTFVNPVFAANPENALITFDAAELNKHYDNRTGTISIRVSRNMRDLLESHYDRPPAATCRHTTVEQNTEHLYDEIPLTVPLCVRKET